jgi:GrpB-like predicted nucleotidyltransferase (UPF0157 family)
MKVKIVPYDDEWKNRFDTLKTEFLHLLKDLSPQIEHMGSTSVEGLWAKPVIDILIGIDHERLDETIISLCAARYAYIKAFTNAMPERRFFIRMNETANFPKEITHETGINELISADKIAHIHIAGYKSPFWVRHVAFRDYLRCHPEAKMMYQQLKQQLAGKEWKNTSEFNEGKASFIKTYEKAALKCYGH